MSTKIIEAATWYGKGDLATYCTHPNFLVAYNTCLQDNNIATGSLAGPTGSQPGNTTSPIAAKINNITTATTNVTTTNRSSSLNPNNSSRFGPNPTSNNNSPINQVIQGNRGVFRVMNVTKRRNYNALEWCDLANSPDYCPPDFFSPQESSIYGGALENAKVSLRSTPSARSSRHQIMSLRCCLSSPPIKNAKRHRHQTLIAHVTPILSKQLPHSSETSYQDLLAARLM